MPQMRAVMSGTSCKKRPRKKPSKKRGGSYISTRISFTDPSSTPIYKAPSPPTRAIAGTWMVSGMGLLFAQYQAGGLFESRSRPADSAQEPHRLPGEALVGFQHGYESS